MVHIGQLPTGGVNVLTTATAQAHVYTVAAEVVHKLIHHILIGLGISGIVYGVVFYNIHQIGRHLAVQLYQVIGVLKAIIKIPE